MLFEIDSLEESVLLDQDFLVAAENLLNAAREGSHILIGDRKVLNWLADCGALSERSRATAKSTLQKISQWSNFKSEVTAYVQIVGGSSGIHFSNGTAIHRLNYSEFTRSALAQPTVMLCENQTDCGVYTHLAAAWCYKQGWKVKSSVERRGGGGSTTSKEFEAALQSRKFVVAIVDSDSAHPGGKYGDTCCALYEKARGLSSPAKFTFCITTTIGRECENLIPHQILRMAMEADDNQSALSSLDILAAISRGIDRAPLLYGDLKNGFTRLELKGLPENDCRLWWQSVEEKMSNASLIQSCPKREACDVNTPCECYIVPGVSHGMLVRVEQMIGSMTHVKVGELLGFPQEELSLLMREIASWICGAQESRT
jgi:hypothetical protein